jgi:hypothetical protein
LRILVLALTLTALCCQSPAQESVPEDARAIYKAFLASYYHGSSGVMNIANQTEIFRPGLGFGDDSAGSCLKEVHIPPSPSKQIHVLDASIVPDGFKARFVSARDTERSLRDPGDAIKRGESVDDAVEKGVAKGVTTLSEIVFNTDRTRAVMSYSFVCGSLCGNGGARLFERHHGKWTAGKRVCGEWVS